MKLSLLRTALVLVAFGAVSHGAAETVTRSQLPAAVEKTLAEQSKDATFRGIEKKSRDGKTVYEALLTIGGHNRDVLIDEKGAIVEFEDVIPFDTLPPAVRSGLQTAAGAGQIVKVEMITRSGKVAGYKAKVATGDKSFHIHVDAEGKPIAE